MPSRSREYFFGAGMSPGEAAAAAQRIDEMQAHAGILAAAQQQARQEFQDRFTGGGQLPGRPPMYRQQWQPLNDLLQRYGFMSRGEGQVAYPGLERGDFPQAMRP